MKNKETNDVLSRIDSLIVDMSSNDIETTIQAFDSASQICELIAKSAVEAFSKGGPACYFRGERIGKFGSLIIRDLEDILSVSDDVEVKAIAAINLLNLGSSAGINVLLKEIESGGEYMSLAAQHLANKGGLEAAPLIIQQLRRINPRSLVSDLSSKVIAIDLSSALSKLGREMPEDIGKRFSADDIPTYVREAINNPNRYR